MRSRFSADDSSMFKSQMYRQESVSRTKNTLGRLRHQRTTDIGRPDCVAVCHVISGHSASPSHSIYTTNLNNNNHIQFVKCHKVRVLQWHRGTGRSCSLRESKSLMAITTVLPFIVDFLYDHAVCEIVRNSYNGQQQHVVSTDFTTALQCIYYKSNKTVVVVITICCNNVTLEVTLCWAQLVPKSVTVSGYNSRCGKFISV